MAAHQIYFRKEQEKLLQEESERLGIDVNDLIKLRIQNAGVAQETLEGFQLVLENFQKTIVELTERVNCFELALLQLIKPVEAEMIEKVYEEEKKELWARNSPQ